MARAVGVGGRRDRVAVAGRVVVVLIDVKTGAREVHLSKNLVTDVGDVYYSQRGAAEVPTNFTDPSGVFDGIVELYNGASAAPAKTNTRANLVGLVGSSAVEMGYPKSADGPTDNPFRGVKVVTALAEFGPTEANATGIADVAITNPSPGASEPLLSHAEFSVPFSKNDSQILRVFCNHSMLGV